MKISSAVILAVLLVLFSACGPKVNDPADVQAIKQSVDDFAKAFNAGDADGMAALMTEKAVYADLNVPVAEGRDAIRALNQGFFNMFTADFSCPVTEARVAGDLATARGTWKVKLTPKVPGAAAVNDGGSWIVVLARQGDGSWKWDWVVANSDQPLPGNTAGGADEQALFQLERDWAQAGLKKDAAVVEKFLANEFVSNYDGKLSSKKQALAELKNNAAKIESAENSDMRVAVFGNTAVVHGLYTEKSTTGGKDSSFQVRYTEVYVKRDGRWQCVTQFLNKV